MKRMCVLLTIVIFIPTSSVIAAPEPAVKLLRGVANIVSAPVEIPKQARAYWIIGAQKTPHIIAWITCGAVWGVVQGVKRASYGLWDVLSFPLARSSNMAPKFQPEYVLQEWPVNPKSGR